MFYLHRAVRTHGYHSFRVRIRTTRFSKGIYKRKQIYFHLLVRPVELKFEPTSTYRSVGSARCRGLPIYRHLCRSTVNAECLFHQNLSKNLAISEIRPRSQPPLRIQVSVTSKSIWKLTCVLLLSAWNGGSMNGGVAQGE